ncbi:hypothetical protein Vadar_018022 [Vaccinium darrowii]|uniref:Uncharacterized protein n=1 Tax=Vaccinium darrowii TaxID=229202 RepID=A0ACB7XB45_9ERIC|nr:hypothetical protein Vadar_018022 [Vaccinium darrowii]
MPSPVNPIHIISLYGGGLMSAAVLALLFVILFIVFLHIYANLFLTQSRPPRRTIRTEVFSSAPRVLGPTRFRQFFDDDTGNFAAAKGLDSSVIAKIPLFVYEENQEELSPELECVICLSVFEEGEFGRKLDKCGHGFHVECIDMWLGSHSNCPTCRAPAVAAGGTPEGEVDEGLSNVVGGGGARGDEEVTVVEVVVENSGNERGEERGVSGGDSSLPSSVWTAAAMGGSLKRMLSRSRSERKSHTLSNAVNELEE